MTSYAAPRAMRATLLLGTILLSSVATVPAMAQTVASAATAQNTASIFGQVTDEDGRAVPGALIAIEELNIEVSANAQGEYNITLPPGTYVLSIRSLGRATTTQTVTAGGGVNVANITLQSDAGNIIVTGSLASATGRALDQQRAADNSVVVLSEDAVGQFPDANISEALQRVPGIAIERDQGEGRFINIRGAPIEFSTVSVDGVAIAGVDPSTRALDLDTISTDIIANLEVTKTLLPNQNADAISGTVNIKTRSAFDRQGTRFDATAGGSYNDFGGNDVRFSSVLTTRLGPDRNIGIVLNGTYSRTDRRVDSSENAWIRRDDGSFGIEETLYKDYDTRRERWAINGALEYQPTPGSKLYLRGAFNRFKDDEFRNRLGIVWDDGTVLPGATDLTATVENTRLTKQFRHRIQVNEVLSVTAGGEHTLSKAEIDYSLNFNQSDQNFPKRNELLFRSTLRPTLSYDAAANPDVPIVSLFASEEHLQLDRFAFRENTFRNNITNSDTWSGQFNVKLPTTLGDTQVLWQAGVALSDREVVADEERFRDRRASADPGPITDFLGSRPSSNFGLNLGQKFDPDLTNAYLNSQIGISPRRLPQSIIADYTADERIIAGYAMARVDFGATDVIVGLRVENTRFDGTAPTFNEDTDVFGVAEARNRYTDFFPNLTVRHSFSEDVIGRFALTRGINRPNFIDIVPRISQNDDITSLRATIGNPDLQPAVSNNVDLSVEYYLPSLGILSGGVFYKDIDDFRFTVTRDGTFQGVPARLTTAENAKSGELYGLELNYNQKFTFLPGALGNFGVFGNYTYTKANMQLDTPFAGRSRLPLAGQSKNTWNASLFYDSNPFTARLAYTKRSDYLDELEADDADLDLFWEGRGQLDLTASARVTDQVTVFFEGKNLTNSAGVRYRGDRSRVEEFEKFGYILFGGIKISLR